MNKKDRLKDRIGRKIFGDIWDNNKQRDMVLLFLWSIFIIFVIVFIVVGKNNSDNNKVKEQTKTQEEVIYPDPINELDKYTNYNYNIAIYNVDSKTFTLFQGSYIDNVDKGVKKTETETKEYTDTPSIYTGYLAYFFRPKNIKEFISNIEPKVSMDNNYKTYLYQGKYDEQDIAFIIRESSTKIVSISFNYLKNRYTLAFELQ